MYTEAFVAVTFLLKQPGFAAYSLVSLCFVALVGQTTIFFTSEYLNNKVRADNEALTLELYLNL